MKNLKCGSREESQWGLCTLQNIFKKLRQKEDLYTSTKVEIIHHQQICIKINVKGNSGRRRRLRGRKERRRGREGTPEGQTEDRGGRQRRNSFTAHWCSLHWLQPAGAEAPFDLWPVSFPSAPCLLLVPFLHESLASFPGPVPSSLCSQITYSAPMAPPLPPWFLSASRGLDTWPPWLTFVRD